MSGRSLTNLARNLRRRQSDAERNLWSRLRDGRLNGIKFRRQQPVGDYIVDFISFGRKLIVEVDGGQHGEPQAVKRDQERTSYLQSKGYRVMRFWDNDVLQNVEGVMHVILESLEGVE
jgi:very-short-patch-repair endonuclease